MALSCDLSQIISQASRIASHFHRRTDEQKYFVLLILTDGTTALPTGLAL